uniref:Uncharacterized protein n=1 Tax=Paramormyrops kingsleyae TaxID=1676925 RepID=A0A3B3SWN2_9TELE
MLVDTMFQRGQIVWAQTAGTLVRKTANSFHMSKEARNRGCKCKITDRNRQALKSRAAKIHRNTASKMTTELNQHLCGPDSTKSVHLELQRKPLVSRAKQKICIPEKWKQPIWSESSFIHVSRIWTALSLEKARILGASC